MYISRPSDPQTILLWGDRWWLAGTGPTAPFGSPAEAVEVLVAQLAEAPKPVRIRLVYQADSFRSQVVPCPQASRALLGAALAPEFPALGLPECAWSHDPVLSAGAGHTTILHFEAEPMLFALSTALALRGLAVVSAWPLATFLGAVPEEWTDSGALTVVALQSERALAYRHPAEGGRSIHQWSGGSTVGDVAKWVAGLLAKNPAEPLLLVCAGHEVVASLDVYIPVGDHPSVTLLQLNQALGQRIVLPRYHPAQLLPPPPFVTAQRAVLAASVGLLFAAAGLGVAELRARAFDRNELKERQARIEHLQADLAHLRDNARDIAASRSLIERGTGGPPILALLDRIGATVPQHIVLDALRISERGFTCNGWIAPAAPTGTPDAWQAALGAASAASNVEAKSGATGGFTLIGRFTP